MSAGKRPVSTSATATDPEAPPGLRPQAIPDARYAINFETSVPAGVRVLMQYFTALNGRDLEAMSAQLHFPVATFEGIEPVIVERPDDLFARTPASMNLTQHPERFTDHDGYLEPGAYDTFEGLEVINANAVCVNLVLSYNRYDRNGHRLLRCDGVYCVTNNDGKWGIQAMSTIFTPANLVGLVHEDTIQAARRLRIDHCLAYMVNDAQAVWGPIRQYGLNVGAGAAHAGGGSKPHQSQDGGSTQNFSGGGTVWQNAPEGRAMQHFRVKGVTNRLLVTDVTPETLAKASIDFEAYRATWAKTGVGHWGWVVGAGPPARVIHATVDKAHMFQGASRYTTSGAFINDSLEVDVITYKKGRWGIAGIFGYMTRHDRANDVRP